jgi:alpha-methylacyl-CoA racemase
MVCAILSARTTGKGQVIDCAMTEGAAVLMGMIWGFRGMGAWKDERGVNMLDTGAHFYDTYECADGKFVSLGSIEPQFYALLRQLTGLDADPDFDAQMDSGQWGALKAKLTALFKSQPRDHWCRLMETTDVCFAPVLSMAEAPDHPHNKARGAFAEIGGMMQPMPAPRYSGTATAVPSAAPAAGTHTAEVLAELGYDAARLQALKEAGALGR